MRLCGPLSCGSLLLSVSLSVIAASAGNDESGFEFEAPPEARHQIGDNLWFGADVVGAIKYTDDLNLDSGSDDHLLLFEPEVRAVLSYAPSSRFLAYTELQFDGRAFLSKGADNDDKSEGHLRIEQIYLEFPRLYEDLGLRIGRQRFKDGRAWWFDEKIDAVRAEWRRGKWFVAAAAAREKMYADDLVHDDTDEKVEFYILNGGFAKEKRDQASLFLIKKKDLETSRHEDPVFIGFQRIGEIGSDVRYWVNAAAVRGHARGRKLRAYGVDSGFSIRFDGDWRPFVSIGLAYGSGDDRLSDGEDGNFRQTGLQDNEGRTFGITSYNYYGEVVDLDLSNLWIGTLGIGIKPDKNTSAELVYHHYRQVDRDDDLFKSDLEVDPNGDHKHLGQEIDFIFAHRPNDKVKLSLTLGAFLPGDAFDNDADPALLAKLKFAYRF
jgi:hypothetical protein